MHHPDIPGQKHRSPLPVSIILPPALIIVLSWLVLTIRPGILANPIPINAWMLPSAAFPDLGISLVQQLLLAPGPMLLVAIIGCLASSRIPPQEPIPIITGLICGVSALFGLVIVEHLIIAANPGQPHQSDLLRILARSLLGGFSILGLGLLILLHRVRDPELRFRAAAIISALPHMIIAGQLMVHFPIG